jgi:hypothetical protein
MLSSLRSAAQGVFLAVTFFHAYAEYYQCFNVLILLVFCLFLTIAESNKSLVCLL